MDKLISIIIPVYNVQNYVEKCLESVLNQTYKNLEIIIVDDGSLDNSYAICEKYANKDKRIKLLSKENAGQGAARNLALDIAQGEYIGFIDSDDIIKEDMFEDLINTAIKYNSDLTLCGLYLNNQGKITKLKCPQKIQVWNSEDAMKLYITDTVIFSGPVNKLYHRSLFDELRFPTIRCREDAFIMHHIISKANKITHIGKSKYFITIREDSTEGRAFSKDRLVMLDIAKNLQDLIVTKYPNLLSLKDEILIKERIEILNDIISTNVYYKYRDICCEQRLILKQLKNDDLCNRNLSNSTQQKLIFICDYFIIYFLFRKLVCIKRRVAKKVLSIIYR